VWVVDGRARAFPVRGRSGALRALEAAGIRVLVERDVLAQRLRQPGQLGKIALLMADAGVNNEIMYSDHDGQLILVVDDFERVVRCRRRGLGRGNEAAQVRNSDGVDRQRWPRDPDVPELPARPLDLGRGETTDTGIERSGVPWRPRRYNPEELLVASLSSCHMLWYLHLCSSHGVVVVNYRDSACGLMNERPDGAGEFVRVTLRPVVTVLPGADRRRRWRCTTRHTICALSRGR